MKNSRPCDYVNHLPKGKVAEAEVMAGARGNSLQEFRAGRRIVRRAARSPPGLPLPDR